MNYEQRHLPLGGTFNVRDLGGYPTDNGRVTRWGQFFRADSLHRLDEHGQQELLNRGITTVIDLRSHGEVQSAPNPLAQHPALAYHHISLFEPLYLGGHLGQGSSLDLPTLYQLALEQSRQPIVATLEVMATAQRSVIFHCTAGKDRTGIIAALALKLAQVHSQTIVNDYAATAHYIAPLLQDLRQQALERQQDLSQYEKLLLAEPQFMVQLLQHLEEQYGGVSRYLEEGGFGLTAQHQLISRLV